MKKVLPNRERPFKVVKKRTALHPSGGKQRRISEGVPKLTNMLRVRSHPAKPSCVDSVRKVEGRGALDILELRLRRFVTSNSEETNSQLQSLSDARDGIQRRVAEVKAELLDLSDTDLLSAKRLMKVGSVMEESARQLKPVEHSLRRAEFLQAQQQRIKVMESSSMKM